MPRRLRRSRRSYGRSLKLVNWNNQTIHAFSEGVWAPNSSATLWSKLITNVSVGDMKVKNFTLRIAIGEGCPCPIAFALVYVPYTVEESGLKLSVGTATAPMQLYDPPQNVIMAGTLPMTPGVPVTFHSRLARNMEPQDKIVLLFNPIYNNASQEDWKVPFDFMLNYVNTFN
jgi:hypothetical protein